jgi:GNAT superfamily N-acetyltransferase
MSDALPGGAAKSLRLPDGTRIVLRTIDREPHAAHSGDQRATIVAEAGGRIVGQASYERVYGPRAAAAIEVDEAFWHRGLPGALLAALGARAARLGIATFLMRVGADEVRLLALLRSDFGARQSRSGAYVELEFSVAPRSSG